MTRSQWQELVSHAREEAPKECCGIMRLRDGTVDDVIRGRNERDSAYGYQLDSQTQFLAYKAEQEGLGVGMYHSHPRSPAEPSQTDINLADYSDYLYVIVSLESDAEVRAWRILDRKVSEEEIEVR